MYLIHHDKRITFNEDTELEFGYQTYYGELTLLPACGDWFLAYGENNKGLFIQLYATDAQSQAMVDEVNGKNSGLKSITIYVSQQVFRQFMSYFKINYELRK